jgi:quinol-cytochrome oxidoreductase complex cytochrome b subunit
MNTATALFFVLYCHILRGVYYKSYIKPRQGVWVSGMVIYVCCMATAFTGYILPWGQMSLWGATVIINFLTIVPVFGDTIVE